LHILFPLCIMFFLTASSSFPPPLSAKEEKELIERKNKGDTEAATKLIEHNLRLCAHIAKKFPSSSDTEDLISIGTIGLIKAINSFNADKNTRLATYAAKCIENEMLMYLRWQKRFSSELYLQEPFSTDKDGNEISLIDTITENSPSIDDTVALDIYSEKLHNALLNSLTPREREIIILRYGLGKNNEFTQREIAKKFNISRSYVSRIEKKALSKLKEAFLS